MRVFSPQNYSVLPSTKQHFPNCAHPFEHSPRQHRIPGRVTNESQSHVMAQYIPPMEDGWLPLYVFMVGATALGNVIQCYTTLSYTKRVYSGDGKSASPATPLSARTFGTWNLVVGIVRIFASFHMNEVSWYQMSLLTNVIGLFHFGTEAFVYKTCKPFGPWLAPVSVAGVGLVWHIMQYDNYIR